MTMRRLFFLAAASLLIPSLAFAQEAQPDRRRPVVAVVLSGGAALGFAHVGALKVIEELGIPVDIGSFALEEAEGPLQ